MHNSVACQKNVTAETKQLAFSSTSFLQIEWKKTVETYRVDTEQTKTTRKWQHINLPCARRTAKNENFLPSADLSDPNQRCFWHAQDVRNSNDTFRAKTNTILLTTKLIVSETKNIVFAGKKVVPTNMISKYPFQLRFGTRPKNPSILSPRPAASSYEWWQWHHLPSKRALI